jgi:FtsH-binding integral membrane protein
LVSTRYALIGALVIELGLVFYLSARIQHIAPGTAKILFLAYAAVTGATFSVIGLVYPPMVIFKAFISTAGVYGAMACYGLVTKRSLQAWGSFLFMGLIGIIIASVVNMFMRSSAMDWVICVIGVLLFAGLTAYDHQKLRVIHATGLDGADDDSVSRVVIMGALTLYLDFINLFLFLLRLFGSSRD